VIDLKKSLKGISILLCFFLFGTHFIFSQTKQNYKTFKGEVVNDTLNIIGIHIINKTSGARSITNQNGLFEIGVKRNDTILISSIQIKPHIIIIESKIFNQDLVRVYVEAFINQLDNVVVKPHGLSGNMLDDMLASGIKDPINFNDVGIPGFNGKREEKIVPVKSLGLSLLLLPLSGGLDIEAVYKHLSGYYKNLRKNRGLVKQYSSAVNIIEFYGLVFFINKFNLNEGKVYEFVLGALENSNIENDFGTSDHGLVLESFDEFYHSINEKN
tara:strand:- start:12901 stop:13713 length:813 start_codon:yes stop_codon:yes gene_type:complete